MPSAVKKDQHSLAEMFSKEQMEKMKQLKDSASKNLSSVVPQLLEILKKINTNLLTDKPDPALGKEYTTGATAVVSQTLEMVSDTLIKLMEVLTPEQKQKLREAMKTSTNPGDFINMIIQ